jgi:hypothetical protein
MQQQQAVRLRVLVLLLLLLQQVVLMQQQWQRAVVGQRQHSAAIQQQQITGSRCSGLCVRWVGGCVGLGQRRCVWCVLGRRCLGSCRLLLLL